MRMATGAFKVFSKKTGDGGCQCSRTGRVVGGEQCRESG